MSKTLFIVVFLFVLYPEGFAQTHQEQKSWQRPTVEGFGMHQGMIDTTEGVAAYLDFGLLPNTKNFDNGGGSSELNTQFLKNYLAVSNTVYDPFMRSDEHNKLSLEAVSHHDFDTATSNSVLNVIDTFKARVAHIYLSCDALKQYGKAYFKVFSGSGSSNGEYIEGGYQSNRPALSYQEEVEVVFGKANVVTDIARHYIIAHKNGGCTSG